MPWWKFWEREQAGSSSPTAASAPSVASRARGFEVPTARQDVAPAAVQDPKLARLYARRDTIMADLSQTELALADENPWFARVETIESALDGIADEIEASQRPPEPLQLSIPQLPVEMIAISDEPAAVEFSVGGEALKYEEEIDWAERGTTIARGDLQLASGTISTITNSTDDLLNLEIERLLFVFANSVRNDHDAGNPAVKPVSLANLGSTCPVCGHLRDLHDVCANCEQRSAEFNKLLHERDRLLQQRSREMEDRDRLIERLPIARKRLAAIDEEIDQYRAG